MLNKIRRKLTCYKPATFQSDQPKAAVLLALTDSEEPAIVLTKRAARLSSHSGEIAFPGGKYDDTDSDLLQTALREAQEEVGLDPQQVEVLGSLGQVMSKHGVHVTPWVGVIPENVALAPNIGELDEVFMVPLRFFIDDKRYCTDEFSFQGKSLYVPAWEFNGHLIWGLTAYMLVELLNHTCDASIPMKPRPEHKVRKW